ncbi:CD99 antigen isoform X2 [Caloenas nicobarica]|uniref:CD99 antigen isoform X2 n=1 Tax=Caloenas nicobarica TaxID=187106 RepID=UPI0032B7EE72
MAGNGPRRGRGGQEGPAPHREECPRRAGPGRASPSSPGGGLTAPGLTARGRGVFGAAHPAPGRGAARCCPPARRERLPKAAVRERAACVGRAAMRRWRLLPAVVLLAALIPVRGNYDDFSLQDAIETTKKPPPSRKPPPSDPDDFSLEHGLQPDDPKPNPPSNPRDTDNPKQGPPAHPKDTGNFDDSDLAGSLPKGGGDGSGSNERKGPSPNEEAEASQGAIAGIVSAVVATVLGAVSSFIAYQKKKLCFKQSDEENVNMDSHRGAQSEPPVQRTLLEN